MLAGQQQRAGDVARVGHVGDEGAGGRGVEAGGGGVVRPRVDVVGGGCVERAAILGEGDAVVELELAELAMGVGSWGFGSCVLSLDVSGSCLLVS